MKNSKHLYMPDGHMEDLYKSSNPLVRWVHTQRVRNAAKLLPLKVKVILDVGCGEGQLLDQIGMIPERKLYGVDVLDNVVKQARKRLPDATIVKADGAKIPFPSGMFDAVTCIDVLEHIPQWREVVDEILRVTKPRGFIVLGWPNDDNWNFGRLLLGKGPVPDHINILTPRIVRQTIKRQPIRTKRIPFSLPWKICLTAQELYIK